MFQRTINDLSKITGYVFAGVKYFGYYGYLPLIIVLGVYSARDSNPL